MGALTIVVAMAFSCLGWGLALLRLLPRSAPLSALERPAWATILGMGLSGWLMFPAALALGAGKETAMAVTAGGLILLALLRHDIRKGEAGQASPPADKVTWILLATAMLIASMDLAAAMMPPADADSMAYHFALPKQYLSTGKIDFTPQAVEAAIPLLLHMTYMQALALGGEFGLTLWCGVSSWFLALGAFAAARRYLSLNQALFLMVAIKSMPAVVYGSPSGQIEVRLAALFLVAAFLTARARRDASWQVALIAGLAAGFCAGAKYSGMVAPVSCGLALIGGRRMLPAMAAFGLAVLVAGVQWYGWNWLHTGDPIFPMLWGKLHYSAGTYWSNDMQWAFSSYMASESGVPKSLFWLLSYPLKATFDGLPIFESGRTGFGPIIFVLLPFALVGLILNRSRFASHELAVISVICLMGYCLWFLGGSSQRVRHFLPELIPLLLAMTVAAEAACRRLPSVLPPLVAGLGLTLLIQMGGLLVFSSHALQDLIGGGSRETYLRHNISAYPLAQWLNTHLRPQDKVLLTNRELIYLLDIPNLYISPSYDGRIQLSPPQPAPQEHLRQMRAQGVTHFVIANLPEAVNAPRKNEGGMLEHTAAALITAGCAEVAGTIVTPPLLQSRTLRLIATVGNETHLVVALHPDQCRILAD